MIVLVTGGRDYQGDVSFLGNFDITLLIHGGASGADLRAAEWCESRGIHTARVKALWRYHGKSAGPKRNEIMLLLKPDLCVAFPGGRGTAHMVALCRKHGIRVEMP